MNKYLLLSAFMAIMTTASAMPDISYEDNTMTFTRLGESSEYDPSVLPLRCGFYDESDSKSLTLYVCVGELYEVEGGTFYSDDLFDTRFVQVNLPYAQIGSEAAIDGCNVTVSFYDMITDSWLVHGEEGTVIVNQTDEHIYDVEFRVADYTNGAIIGGHYCHTDAWRWRDYNEERPNPNQFELKKNGIVQEQHDLLSCVVDERNAEIPVFYLADEPGLTSVEEVLGLKPRQYVIIKMPTSLMDGLIKGFSGWSDDNMTVTFNGVDYNHSGCINDETCYGGNVQIADWNHEEGTIEINSMIFTMIQEDYCNMILHYAGSFVVDGTEEAICNIQTDAAQGFCFDLMGRLQATRSSHSFVICNGKIQIIYLGSNLQSP